jgi:hypothetical protein
VFGDPETFAASIGLSTLNGGNGFKISGDVADDQLAPTTSPVLHR